MTKLDLIDTTIQPDPFKPQAGDVYEFGHPFTQRLVVEDAPSVGDFRVRFRIDGGDSSLTSVRAFHLLLAGFRGLRGIGRVVEMTAENAAVWARSKRAERAEEHANPDLAPFANLSVADIAHAAWLCGYGPGDEPMQVFKLAAARAAEWQEIEGATRQIAMANPGSPLKVPAVVSKLIGEHAATVAKAHRADCALEALGWDGEKDPLAWSRTAREPACKALGIPTDSTFTLPEIVADLAAKALEADGRPNVSLWTVQAALTKLAGSPGRGLCAELVAEAIGLMREDVAALPEADPLAYTLHRALQRGVSVGMSWSGKADDEQHAKACAEVDKLGDPEQVAQLKGLRPWAMVRELVGRLVQERRNLDDARAKLVSEQVDVSERRTALEAVQSSLRAAMFSVLGREDSTLSTLELVTALVAERDAAKAWPFQPAHTVLSEVKALCLKALGLSDGITLDLVEQLAAKLREVTARSDHAIRERDEQINTLFSQRDRFFDDYTIVAKREKATAARLTATERRIADGDNAIQALLTLGWTSDDDPREWACNEGRRLDNADKSVRLFLDQIEAAQAAITKANITTAHSTSETLNELVVALNGRTVFVSGTMARELSEALYRHNYVINALQDGRDQAAARESDLRREVDLLKQRVATYEEDFGSLIAAGWTNGHPVKWAQDKFAELTKERDEARQFGSGLEAALVAAQEEIRMLRDREDVARLDRTSTAAWMQSSPLDCLDDSPDIRCWPATGIVIPGSAGPVLTIMPEDGGSVAIVHMEDVAAWLQAYNASVAATKDEARIMCSDCGDLHVRREDCPVERHWTDCPKCFQRNGPDTDDCVAYHCSGCGHDYVPTKPVAEDQMSTASIAEALGGTVMARTKVADLVVTVLVVKSRIVVQKQKWTSEYPDFDAASVSLQDDDPRFSSGMGLGDRAGTWTWRGTTSGTTGWAGEWTPETSVLAAGVIADLGRKDLIRVDGVATEHIHCLVGEPLMLSNADDAGVTSWRWSVVAPQTSDPKRRWSWGKPHFSFTTDVLGDYTVHLHVVREGSEQELTLTVRAS